jgi:hypothetical protein
MNRRPDVTITYPNWRSADLLLMRLCVHIEIQPAGIPPNFLVGEKEESTN